jgi:nucleoside diphosphate kinase
MNKPEITGKIVQYIVKAQNNPVLHEEIFADKNVTTSKHEFLFFIKPEITLKDPGLKTEAIINMMLDKIEKFGLAIRDIRILGASYLDKYNIIARHYGVINAMSRNPVEYFSQEASDKFRDAFGVEPDETNVIGSLEFLKEFVQFDPVSLESLWQNSKSVKLAGGTYCAPVAVDGQQLYLVNGFHPRQLIHFTEKGRSIVAFTLTGDLNWSDARNNFIGKTNPADAAKGSLRNDLLVNQERYGLKSVSPSNNGFHLSAGPVEGLVELIRYCSDFSTGREKEIDDFLFGRQLLEVFTPHETNKICDNSFVISEGKKISVFDLTEEKNSDVALELLRKSSFAE